jgi:predicted flap endonuclease-1-like 5' DNA nuclease
MAGKKKTYRIWGKVLEKESGKGVPNITVEAYDKDLRYDDALGSSVTDKDGRFLIKYSEKDFRDLYVFDRKPDLYLTLYDWLGTRIKSTKDRIRYKASEKEGFYIKLPRNIVSKIPQPKKKETKKPEVKEPEKAKPKAKGRTKMKLKTQAPKKTQKPKAKAVGLLDIPGIGSARAKKLEKAGITTAKGVSRASEKRLKEALGNMDIKKLKSDCDKVLKKNK